MVIDEFKCPNCSAKEINKIGPGKYECVYCKAQWSYERILEEVERAKELEELKMRLDNDLKDKKQRLENELKKKELKAEKRAQFWKSDSGIILIVSVGVMVVFPLVLLLIYFTTT